MSYVPCERADSRSGGWRRAQGTHDQGIGHSWVIHSSILEQALMEDEDEKPRDSGPLCLSLVSA